MTLIPIFDKAKVVIETSGGYRIECDEVHLAELQRLNSIDGGLTSVRLVLELHQEPRIIPTNNKVVPLSKEDFKKKLLSEKGEEK